MNAWRASRTSIYFGEYVIEMQKAGQPLTTSTIQPIVQGMIESLALEIMIDALGNFKVTREWIINS